MIEPGTIGTICIALAVAVPLGIMAYITNRRPKNTKEPLTDTQNDAVDAYMRENPAPSLLIEANGVRPVYDLDDRFMRKVSKIEINGRLYCAKAEWKPELIGVRSSGYFLECTAHDTPSLSLSKDVLRELKRTAKLVMYCFTEVDFSDEEA